MADFIDRLTPALDVRVRVVSYLQYSIRVGSGSPVGACPSPDSHNELVLLQSSCNAGVDWQLLRQIDASHKHTQPMYVHVFHVISVFTGRQAELATQIPCLSYGKGVAWLASCKL